jgi:trehalose utilization protein
MGTPIQVVVWGEFRHEKTNPKVAAIYADGIQEAIAGFLRPHADLAVTAAFLDQAENGLSPDLLEKTDVLIWWGHMAHGEVSDEVVANVHRRVLEGMGLIVLHSAHYSKIFKSLMGTTCSLKWRESSDKERVWNIAPHHPITSGLGDFFVIPTEEMYGEPFAIPEPDEVIFISWFTGGEVFRSGATWRRGSGRVFYFQPGHETYPTYHQQEIQQVITNAVRWAAATVRIPDTCPNSPPLEPLPEDPQAADRSSTRYD